MKLICGFWNQDGSPAALPRLEDMCRALQKATRIGQVTTWISSSVGLAVLDFGPATGDSSIFQSPDGDVFAGDLRLNNAQELGPVLSTKVADPLRIAAALTASMEASQVRRLLGEFALAGWNPRRQRLRLIRDALGVRPLVYHHQPGRHLVFASFPRGIFASGLLSRSLNELALGRQVLHAYRSSETLFQNVAMVPPGHALEFSPEGLRDLCFWRPERLPALTISRKGAADQLCHLVRDAVGDAIAGQGDIAAHLSGGLDSSSLTALAAQAVRGQSRKVRAYSFLGEAWPGVPLNGEEPFVEALLQQEPEVIWQPIAGGLPADWLHDRWNEDVPLSLSAMSPENLVCDDASRHGASLLLSGWGGDEGITFNGRGALAFAFRSLRWRYLLSEIKALQTQRNFSLVNILIGDVLQPQLSRATNERLRRAAGRAPLPQVVEPGLLAEDIRKQLTSAVGLKTGPDPGVNQVNLLRSGHLSHRTTNFAAVAERYGMAFSFPLLDRRLVEFALAMPRTWHLQNGFKRSLYRESMQGILPPSIQWRHNKLLSLPRVLYQFTSARQAIIDRVGQLARHPLVDHLFDLRRFKELLQALPEAAAVRHPAAEPALAAVPAMAHALSYAFFVEQNF